MPTAAKAAQPDNDAALAAAYARLSADDGVTGPITVRALRAEAGVSSAAASVWLKAHRAAQGAPGPVPDDLAALVPLADLWARAVVLARDEVRTEHVVALADAHDARVAAEQAAAAAEARADRVAAETGRLAEKLAAAEAALADQRRFQEHCQRAADAADQRAREAEQAADRAETAATERVHAAELAQVKAEAQAAALREALEAIRPAGD